MAVNREQFRFDANMKSVLGKDWFSMYSTRQTVNFKKTHFETAMMNVIREPNINSSAILRADILKHFLCDRNDNACAIGKFQEKELQINDSETKTLGINDFEVRYPPINPDLRLYASTKIIRRIVPRNPYKDAIMNQTCLILNGLEDESSSLVIYIPHLEKEEECPFYIPHVKAVAIFLYGGKLSVHYIPFPSNSKQLGDESDRVVRTAGRLLQTAYKHSTGVMQGYQKRVKHDLVVNKIDFQDRYIALKKKYSKHLVCNWQESTDPKKHVFEDIAIAAFLIALWVKVYGPNFREKIQFRDLGCGNGVLCYILLNEDIRGIGIDARRRKSWSSFPSEIQACLKEQVIIPSILVRPHPEVKKRIPELEHNSGIFPVKVSHELMAPATVAYTSEDLLNSPEVNVAEFPENTFIIGNHSDELTCWIPLLGFPFMVIPCCSHNFSGQRVRFNVRKSSKNTIGNSTYAGLVDHVNYIACRVGWEVEQEMLRIPSTRNAAIIGYKNNDLKNFPTQQVYETIMEDGGPDGWIQNSMVSNRKNPRNH